MLTLALKQPMEQGRKIICQKEIELLNKTYVVYLKEVATKVAAGGAPLRTTVRAFIIKKNIKKEVVINSEGGYHDRPRVC